MPTATGTGFFISEDGWFLTAAHVVTKDGSPRGKPRDDLGNLVLQKETRVAGAPPGAMCQFVSLETILPDVDLALLKVDYARNANKAWLDGASTFPFIPVSRRPLEEAEPVYAFGYPLPDSHVQTIPGGQVGFNTLRPRVTSAIVSSTFDQGGMVITGTDPVTYVLDKALNYGNSGGPIVSCETGNAHAICSSFQPVMVPQHHLADSQGKFPHVMVPSLYGRVSSLSQAQVLKLFAEKGIATSLA